MNSSFEDYYILLMFKNANEYGEYTDPYKVSIGRSYRDFEKGIWCTSDLYTDEDINTIEKIVPFLKQNDVVDVIYGVSKESNHSVIKRLTNPYLLDILQRMIWDTSTVGEAVELYEQLPAEYKVDYSYFDFANSPNIDPAWLADRPAFVPTPVPTPSPVPTPTPTPPPYQELALGSRGQAVLDMKGRFYELGYFRTTEFSDQFNKNTADTVRLFETNNGLPVDGVADAVMLALLFSDGAVGK